MLWGPRSTVGNMSAGAWACSHAQANFDINRASIAFVVS